MSLVRLDPAPALLGVGVLTPLGVGTGSLAGAAAASAPRPSPEVTTSLPDTCGAWAAALRRADRYGALGFTAARLALREAGVEPPQALDAEWGVMMGSTLGCWGSNAQHHRNMRGGPGLEPSPAVFVRTVSSAVNGDISIAWRLGGPSATFVSGWSAGAEAVISAAAVLSQGRARRMLAGGVEAPAGPFRTLHAAARLRTGGGWLPAVLAEGAAVGLMDAEGRPGVLRLRAFARMNDRSGSWSFEGLLRAIAPLRIGGLVIANSLPGPMRIRLTEEAGCQVIYLPERTGEIGAAGAVVGMALASVSQADSTFARDPSGGAVIVLARGVEGGTVVLVLAP